MIIIMKSDATEDDLKVVLNRLADAGLRGELSLGVERTVIGVIGPGGAVQEIADAIASLQGVESTVRISKPFKLVSREFQHQDSVVRVGHVKIGGGELAVIAGPCSVETEKQTIDTAIAVKAAGATLLRGGAFKPRTSPYSFRGLGLKGLQILAKAREETGLPVITEVMAPEDVGMVAEYADVLQLGARNMQNFSLLEEAGKSGKPCMVKRGPSATIEEWLLAAEYVMGQGNRQVILCERGIRTFETYTRNTMDVSAIPVAKRLSHLPVIGDPAHGTGWWYLVTPLALASIAAGADGIAVEVHPNPDTALSDGPQSLTFERFRELMAQVREVAAAVQRAKSAVAPV